MYDVPIIGDCMQTQREVIPSLDGLRGLAILLVLFGHLPSTIRSGAGDFGVDLFFVLSGFLITRILLYNKQHAIPLRTFLARRAVRIFPIYYLTLLAVGLSFGFKGYLYTLTYTYNFMPPTTTTPALIHTWSLCVEEHFYLIWPLVVTFMSFNTSRRIAGRMLIVIIVVSLVYRQFCAAWGWGNYAAYQMHANTFFRACSLLSGCLLAYYEPQWRKSRHWGLGGMGLFAVGAVVYFLGPATVANFPLQEFNVLIGRMVAATGMFLISVLVLPRLFSWPPLRWMGKISYGLYLYHFPIYNGILGTVSLWLVIPAAFAVATVSFYLIERPLLRWVHRKTPTFVADGAAGPLDASTIEPRVRAIEAESLSDPFALPAAHSQSDRS